jgi:hypothetical protein
MSHKNLKTKIRIYHLPLLNFVYVCLPGCDTVWTFTQIATSVHRRENLESDIVIH